MSEVPLQGFGLGVQGLGFRVSGHITSVNLHEDDSASGLEGEHRDWIGDGFRNCRRAAHRRFAAAPSLYRGTSLIRKRPPP